MAAAEPMLLEAGGAIRLPDPNDFDGEGLVAVGGDLSPARLLHAYAHGVFPWYDEGYLPMWWSPDPRGHLPAAALHVSRSLAKMLRRHDFRLTWNRAFEAVMRACGERRAGGTWVIPEMLAAYTGLHRLGHAHSLEVWRGAELVGGVYGVQLGGLFCAESKFHRDKDMSKVALVALVRSLAAHGIELLDVQFVTDHLRRLGAVEMPRREYLARAAVAVSSPVDLSDLTPGI